MLIPIKFAEGSKPDVPKSVQLLKVGNFFQENGKQLAVTQKMLRDFKKNFDQKVRGYEDGKLPVDYFHENEKVAGGWIAGLELREGDSQLWAEVEWTPRAAQMLADGELRYISAEFHFDYRHNEGGKKFGPTLFGAGLTNRPFIKGMQAVVNLSEGEGQMDLEQALAKIKELEAKIAAMHGGEKELADAKKALSETSAKLAELQKKYEDEKVLAEKTTSFNRMLSEGKACEAQREHFISGDMVKFAEAAMPLNPKGKGSESTGDKGGEGETAVEKIDKLAEKIRAEKKVDYRKSVSMALSENPELAKKYDEETAIA